MSEENITLISKKYAESSFQSKLTEANEGDNIKITREGDNLKISAEIPAPGQTTITSSDERVVVNKTETGYDLALNGSFIERGEYTELENTVDGHTTSIAALDNDVNTVKGDVDDLKPEVATLEQSVEGNTQAITALEQEVANKQDNLTAGTGINLNNNTISVNTATSVGISDLPITDRAVGDALNDYVNDIQAEDDSITVTKTGSTVTLKANSGGNYVPLGSYGDDEMMGALPVGSDSTASANSSIAIGTGSEASADSSIAIGEMSLASEDNSIAIGTVSGANANGSIAIGNHSQASDTCCTAIGDNSAANAYASTAIGDNSAANAYASTAIGSMCSASGTNSITCGVYSKASGLFSTVYGVYSECSGSSSFAIGPHVKNNAGASGALGNFIRNSNDNTIVIGTFSGESGESAQFTQLYLIAAGSELSNLYCEGEAGLGYITTQEGVRYDSSNWQILYRGTRKLSDLLTDNTTDFTPDLSLN